MTLQRKKTRRLTANGLSVYLQTNNHTYLYMYTTSREMVLFKFNILAASLIYFNLKTVNKSFLFLIAPLPATQNVRCIQNSLCFFLSLSPPLHFISSYSHLLFLPSPTSFSAFLSMSTDPASSSCPFLNTFRYTI